MKNNKKLLVALGLVLFVVGGMSNTVWAMEQPSLFSEMVELHKVISQKLFNKNDVYNSLLSILRKYNYRELIITETVYIPEDVYFLIAYVYRPNFLQKNPIEKLCSLKELIKTLNDIAETIQKQESAVPGTIKPEYQEGYNGITHILPKLQRLFDLIQNSSGITDEEINKILRQSHEYK